MKQLAYRWQRWQRVTVAAAISIVVPGHAAVAQGSQPVAAPWWPSSIENRVSSLALFGNVMQCTIDRCDHAASLGADMRVAGPLHVAVDARAPGLDYSAWYGWRRVSIGATVGRGTAFGPPIPSRQASDTTVQLSGSGRTTVDTPVVSSKRDAVRWSSAAARLTWREDRWWATALLGRVTVAGQGGAVWGGLQLGADVGRGVSLLLGAGTSTRLFALAAPEPGRRNLNLGLGFNTSILSRQPSDAPKAPIETRAAFDVSSISVDRVRITIRAPAARTIEFASDCTGWKPLAMTQGRDGWVVEIAALRGLHRANIRVDGAHWIAPPGLASADDDFAGEVGIFVVE